MKEIKLIVKGMMCESCENRVRNALIFYNDSLIIDISHEKNYVKIKSNQEINLNEIKNIIKDLGYDVQ